MRFFVTLLTISILFITLAGCKTSKTAFAKVPENPHTDTLKIVVNYQTDSLQVYVKKIIVSDSLYAVVDDEADFNIVATEQKDSVLFITLSSHNACSKTDFDLYQSSIIFKTYPPRIRCRVAKTKSIGCEEKTAAYTLALDIRPLLKDYPEVNLWFSGSQKTATLKRW